MDFSQSLFWVLLLFSLPFLFLGNYLFRARPKHCRCFQQVYIIVLSLTMLGVSSIETLVIFLAVTLVAYFSCQWANRRSRRSKKLLLVFLIPILFIPLIYYKYSYFLFSPFNHECDTLKGLIVPIGLSFYSFQTVGFCVDSLLRGMQMPNLREYMLFCSFFPQIAAGPIERREALLPQVQRLNMHHISHRLNIGIRYIILGLFFKMTLADNLAYNFISNYQGCNPWIIWMNNALFSFRIYFDFAGYGLTAYGFARCFGIHLQMNFLTPYTATNIGDFWRRWHRSLTEWFRDYIYFPLGGSRTRFWAVNMLIVFFISGLWHGAGWNFIVWGLLSGIALIVHRFWRKTLHMPVMPAIIGWAFTMMYMLLIWMFFYDVETNNLIHHLQVIFSPQNYFLQSTIGFKVPHICEISFFLLFSISIISCEWLSAKRRKNPYAIFLRNTPCAVMFFLLIFLTPTQPIEFIYFVF